MKINHKIKVNNITYHYSLEPLVVKNDEKITHVICEEAGIDKDFLTEDIPSLIIDLPNLIIAEKDSKQYQIS